MEAQRYQFLAKASTVLVSGNGNTVLGVQIDGSLWKFLNAASGWSNLTTFAAPNNDTWYRITIDFECTAGGYQGLAQYKYTIYIDGTEQDAGDLSFDNNEAHVDDIQWYTDATDTAYSFFVDAIGYTWDAGYSRGDNAGFSGKVGGGATIGDITFGGDKTLRTILNEFAAIDQCIWYLSPTGIFYYDPASTDSGVDHDEDDGLWSLKATDMILNINRVEVLGGLKIDGTQASGLAENTDDQDINGIILYKDTDASLLTDSLCDSKAQAILEETGNPPKQVQYFVKEDDYGLVQPGENYTFSYDSKEMEEITESQFIIMQIRYNTKHKHHADTIADGLVFKQQVNDDVVQENSQMIQQNREQATLNTPIGTILIWTTHTAPDGWLICDGSSISRTTYADLFAVISTAFGTADGSSFNIPDFLGQFLRGRADGDASDPDRASRVVLKTGGATGDNVGSYQNYTYQSHRHPYQRGVGGAPNYGSWLNAGWHWTWNGQNTSYAGGNETRPTNVYVNFIIKY